MNGQRTAERLTQAGHQELLSLEAVQFEGTNCHLMPERQLGRVENAVDANKNGAGPAWLVQINIRPAIAIAVDLLDVVIVEE